MWQDLLQPHNGDALIPLLILLGLCSFTTLAVVSIWQGVHSGERHWKGSRYARPDVKIPLRKRRVTSFYPASTRRKVAALALQYGSSDEEADDPWGDGSEEDLNDEYGSHVQKSTSSRMSPDAGVCVLPTVYKTAEGACTIETVLDDVSSVRELVMRIVETGQKTVDPEITPSAIRIHFVQGEHARPRKITRRTEWNELMKATALVVTPASDV